MDRKQVKSIIAIILFMSFLLFGCRDDIEEFGPYRSIIAGTYGGYIWLVVENKDNRPSKLYELEIIEKGDDHYEFIFENIILKDKVIKIPNLEFKLIDHRIPEDLPCALINLSSGQVYKNAGKPINSYMIIHSDEISLEMYAEKTDDKSIINSFCLRTYLKPR